MGCGVKMEQVVPVEDPFTGIAYTDKVVPAKCGQTSIHGTELRCEKCSQKRPWYICKHGQDVSEYMCGRCEMES
jgi:hypothetical protein